METNEFVLKDVYMPNIRISDLGWVVSCLPVPSIAYVVSFSMVLGLYKFQLRLLRSQPVCILAVVSTDSCFKLYSIIFCSIKKCFLTNFPINDLSIRACPRMCYITAKWTVHALLSLKSSTMLPTIIFLLLTALPVTVA